MIDFDIGYFDLLNYLLLKLGRDCSQDQAEADDRGMWLLGCHE